MSQQESSNNNNSSENIDVIRKILGEGGKWQFRIILMIYLVKIPSAWFMACVIFTAPAPWNTEIICKPPTLNVTVGIDQIQEWNSIVHPVVEDYHKEYIDVCQIYKDAEERWQEYVKNDTKFNTRNKRGSSVAIKSAVPCNDFQFYTEYETVVTKFGLVCAKNWLVSLTQSFHLLGVLIGFIVANELLKHHPPKFVMKLGMVLQVIYGCLTGQVPYMYHSLLRTADAVCCVLMYGGGGLIFSDITDGKWRLAALTLFETFWSTGLLLLPGIGYFFKNWYNIYYAISIPTILMLPLQKFIPNSPYWLLKRGNIEETKEVLLEAARVNNRLDIIPKDIDEQLKKQMTQLMAESGPSKWSEIWEDWRTNANLACVHLSQTLSIILYYAILLNISVYGREYLYINTVVAGVFEIIGAVIGYVFVRYTKRYKWQLTGLLNISGGLLFFTTWFYDFDESNAFDKTLLVSTSMLAKAAISCSLAVMAGCTSELVTGNRKKTAVYSMIVFSRFWLLFGPFIGASWYFLGRMSPPSLMGGLTILNGIFNLLTQPKSISNIVGESYKTNNGVHP